MYNPLQLPPEVLELQSKQIEEMVAKLKQDDAQPSFLEQMRQHFSPEEFERQCLNTPDIDDTNRHPLGLTGNRRMRRAEQAKRRRLSRY